MLVVAAAATQFVDPRLIAFVCGLANRNLQERPYHLFYDGRSPQAQKYSVPIFILARGRPAAARHELTTNDVNDASQVGPLLDQVVKPLASFTGDGAYDEDSVYRILTGRQLKAAVIVPPRETAVFRGTATIEPTGHCHQSFPVHHVQSLGAGLFSRIGRLPNGGFGKVPE
jgi:hypothetical protein